MKTFEFEKQGIKFYVELDIKNKVTYDDERIQDLTRVLSQIPRVVEFLQSGETEVWADLRRAGWGWIPPPATMKTPIKITTDYAGISSGITSVLRRRPSREPIPALQSEADIELDY